MNVDIPIIAIPSLCLNSLSFTNVVTTDTTVGQNAMPNRKNNRPDDNLKSKSSFYSCVFIGVNVYEMFLKSAASISFLRMKSST